MNPDSHVTPELRFLQAIERGIRVLDWRNTEDGQKGRRPPEPIPVTTAEIEAAEWERAKHGDVDLDVMSKDDLARMLGWAS